MLALICDILKSIHEDSQFWIYSHSDYFLVDTEMLDHYVDMPSFGFIILEILVERAL